METYLSWIFWIMKQKTKASSGGSTFRGSEFSLFVFLLVIGTVTVVLTIFSFWWIALKTFVFTMLLWNRWCFLSHSHHLFDWWVDMTGTVHCGFYFFPLLLSNCRLDIGVKNNFPLWQLIVFIAIWTICSRNSELVCLIKFLAILVMITGIYETLSIQIILT